MSIELKVPSVGESITEVQIGDWLKSEGDAAERDEALVVIETDKVTVELPAPVAGRITKVLVPSGETAKVGDVIGTMEENAEEPSEEPGEEPAEDSKESRSAGSAKSGQPRSKEREERGSDEEPDAGREMASTEKGSSSKASKARPRDGNGRSDGAETRITPAARRALAQRDLRAEDVTPSGPGGRLLKEDVLRHADDGGHAPAVSADDGRAAPSGATGGLEREEEVVPMTPLRKRIAERLVEAQHTAAILTTFNEIDMSAVMELRARNQERFQERYGIKLGFMSFFVKAAVDALKLVPQVNAEVRDGDSIAYRNYFDVGIAVGGGKGLVVPILRNAERLSFAEVELAISDLAERAKTNQLTLDELQGGTFTISNGGIYGSLLSTPILNPPQSGILGLHAIQERAVVRDGQIVARPMMYVALSYDHRLVDGREAVTFLKRIKEGVEDPARLLLEV